MEPSKMSEELENAGRPPAYQANPGYPPGPELIPAQDGYPLAPGAMPAQGIYPAVQGYLAQPYPGQVLHTGQPTVTVQPTVFVTPALQVVPVPDYLGYSIFTMLCCCLPLGIAALIYSINTRDANLTGNRELAVRNSRVSRLLNNIALGLGIVSFIICIIIIIVSATTTWKRYNHYYNYN